jgi:hypothetical protein
MDWMTWNALVEEEEKNGGGEKKADDEVQLTRNPSVLPHRKP